MATEAATERRSGPLRPGSTAWMIAGEGVMLLGGGRALILQVAHPGVAAGVAEHSDYRNSPWSRLRRTIEVSTTVALGDRDASREAADALRRVHSRVRGEDDLGCPYSALDPRLLMWVQATLIDTALLIYDRYVRRLSEAERAAYYEQMRPVSAAYGIPAAVQPADWPAFRRYFEGMLESGLRVTDTTREVAASVLEPALPWPARAPLLPVIEALRLVTVGTLPASIRTELGLPWGPLRRGALETSQATIRLLLPLLPGLLRRFPAANRRHRGTAG